MWCGPASLVPTHSMPGAAPSVTATNVPRRCPVSPGWAESCLVGTTALQNWLLARLPHCSIYVPAALTGGVGDHTFQAGLCLAGGRPCPACPVPSRPREIGLTRRSSPRRSVMPSEGQRIDLQVAKILHDIPFCYLKRCLSNSVMERPGLGPGTPWPAGSLSGLGGG